MGSRIEVLGFRVKGMVQGSVDGVEMRVWGLGLRVEGVWCMI